MDTRKLTYWLKSNSSCKTGGVHRYRDHPLTGEWKDHRDCHIKPDLVLIYQKTDDSIMRLVRIGSHSELSL
ncbi:type II toxin-antitoxin system YafQ family toxin [Solimicrobium silvestre]|uniref:type II toxin-antitoxin system YafQ family toxin n=1 Tax=Solimicrobium silvestre TaxID=2099400 RepID=UPI001FAF2191|nr:type II toxin-antitoxin system YafQ family toxin [Solimicrobium silvestre]